MKLGRTSNATKWRGRWRQRSLLRLLQAFEGGKCFFLIRWRAITTSLSGERWAPSRCSGPSVCPLWVVHSLDARRTRVWCLTISHSRFPHLGGVEDGRESTLSCSSLLTTTTISESPRNRPALLSPECG